MWLVVGGAPTRVVAEDKPRVVVVEVQGTHTIAKETCLAQMQTRPGAPYLENVVSEDIRRLYALGYFTDVQVETEPFQGGLKVLLKVKEKPSIGAIQLEGYRHLRKERITELLGVKAGELYDPRKLKEGLDKLKAEYQRKGYAQVEVETSTKLDEPTNAATLYLVIDEGPRMRIKQILVEGNLAFPDNQIRKVLKTKQRHWFSSGVYNDQVLEEDLERVRAFYRKHGYQDVQVTQETSADPSGKGLYVKLKVAEGLQHRIGQVAIAGAVLYPEHELRRLLSLKPGAVFSPEALQDDLRAIKQYYGNRGYINAQVTPETQLEATTKRVDLTLRIAENELAYVNRIEVQGNLHTKDVVVRREMRIYPGEAFNGAKVRRSIERLYNLGIFEEVNVDTAPTPRPNYEDLVVSVKEAKTGSFSFGGGVSSVDRLVGLVEVEQRNFDLLNYPSFVGAGQDMRFKTEIGSVRRFFDFSFTEPWIFGHPFSFGVDAFDRTQLQSRNLGLGFEEKSYGGGIRLGKEITETVRAGLSYQLFRTIISSVADEASDDLKAEEGHSDVSEAGLTLTWDTRDNRFDPTKGFLLFSAADWAGGILAGSRNFYRLRGGGSAYMPHWNNRLVLESRIEAGIVNSYGKTDKVPIFERFFAGGANTIRGFRERRVGPRDPKSNDPIGGEGMLIASMEETATIVHDEKGKPIVRGAVFFDAGNVWSKVGDFGKSLEAGTGFGARVNTPIGPLRLDVGFPITQLGTEKRRPRLHFNVSRSF